MEVLLLKSSDNKIVEFKNSSRCILLKNLMENTKIIEPIEVLVSQEILLCIQEFMKIDDQLLFPVYELSEIVMTKQIRKFYDELTCEKLGHLLNAANYLYYPVLLETGCNYMAFLVDERSPNDLKNVFGNFGVMDEGNLSEFNSKFDWMSGD